MLSLSRVAHALLRTAAPVFIASTVVTATSSIALAADNASASTPNIPHLERIDPLYRPYAAMMIGDYSNDEAVAKANAEFAKVAHFTTIVPELIKVKNEQDGFEVEVAIYKPQKCEQNTPKCPVFAYDPQYTKADPSASTHPLVLYSHAGGFLVRANYYLADNYQMISNTLQAVVAVPRYRLSSEAPFPAPIIDNYSALSYLIEHAADYNIDPEQVLLMGTSVGGGMSVSLSLYNRDHKNYPIKGQALIYPMLDYHTGNPDYGATSEYIGQVAWDAKSNAYAWEKYGDATAIAALSGHTLPDEHGKSNDITMMIAIPPHLQALKNFHHEHQKDSAIKGEPDYFGYYSPSMAKDLSSLPPAFINVGDIDLFAPESLKFASRMLESGNTVEMHLVPGVYHLFEFLDPNAAPSQQYYERLFYFMDQRLMAPQGQVWPEAKTAK